MKKEAEIYLDKFSKKYGETMALRANLAAINRMLIKRNRGDELLDTIKIVCEEFENKVEGENSDV